MDFEFYSYNSYLMDLCTVVWAYQLVYACWIFPLLYIDFAIKLWVMVLLAEMSSHCSFAIPLQNIYWEVEHSKFCVEIMSVVWCKSVVCMAKKWENGPPVYAYLTLDEISLGNSFLHITWLWIASLVNSSNKRIKHGSWY